MDYPYFDGFDDQTDVLEQFEAPKDALDDAELLYAYYSYDNYSGSAVVIFRKNGELKLVSGSHCSCHGLEGQWGEEPITVEALKTFKGSYDDYSRWDEFVNSLEV